MLHKGLKLFRDKDHRHPSGFGPMGVNIISHHLYAANGVGQSSRNFIKALERAKIPAAIYPMDSHRIPQLPEINLEYLTHGSPYHVNVFFANANETEATRQMVGTKLYNGRYNIGYWSWETANFPQLWSAQFQTYDEIWVLSNFVQNSLAQQSPIPVVCLPGAIEPMPVSSASRQDFGLPDNAFLVLFVFDARSVPERKNPLDVIRAYESAFTEQERLTKTRLVIKVAHLDASSAEAAELKTRLAKVHGILIADAMDRNQVNQLLNLADVYISLHRSEGFGLTIAEAMYFGKPVIATHYSGNVDFMTPFNSYPVPYQLVSLEKDYAPYLQGDRWAQPDWAYAARMLRHIYEHRDEAHQRGKQASQDIRTFLSAGSTGDRIAERLKAIERFKS